jgi:hypothetical protein
MPSEFLMLRQFLGAMGPDYAQTALLIGLLLAALFRPERIRSVPLIRASCVFLALSIVAPAVLYMLISTLSAGNSRAGFSGPLSGTEAMLMALINVVGPMLLGLSIVLGVFSLLPGRDDRLPLSPTKHPLD